MSKRAVAGKPKTTRRPAPPRKRLSAKNRAAIKLLDEWMSKPDDLGEEWWNEYMKQLKGDRFTMHREQ